MAIAVEDFTRPKGRLRSVWFEDTLADLLSEWVTEASADTAMTDDTTRQAYVYWRAYTTLTEDLRFDPADQQTGPERDTRTEAQLAYFEEQAAYWYRVYQDGVSTDAGGAYLGAIGYADNDIENPGL